MLYDYTGKSEDGVLELLPESAEDDDMTTVMFCKNGPGDKGWIYLRQENDLIVLDPKQVEELYQHLKHNRQFTTWQDYVIVVLSKRTENKMKLLLIAYVVVQYNYPMFTYNMVNGIVNLIETSMVK